MKRNQIKTRWGWALGLVLLAAAPFAASAGFGAASRAAAATPPKPDEVVIELDGKMPGKRSAYFLFEGNTIQFNGDGFVYPNPPFRVNGVLWEDMKTPFHLNFTPDFENASILEKNSHDIQLTKAKTSFSISIQNRQNYDEPYKVRIAAKYQKKREDDKPKMIPAREIKNPPALTTNGETIVYGPMMISSINEPTDGMDHPNYSVSRPVHRYRHDHLIVITGTVDQMAGFRIQGNYVFYQNYTTRPLGTNGVSPVLKGGKFASGVTVDGKSWSNLTKPFQLDFTPPITSAKNIIFRAEQCEIAYANHDNVLEITIANKSNKPAPFELVLQMNDLKTN